MGPFSGGWPLWWLCVLVAPRPSICSLPAAAAVLQSPWTASPHRCPEWHLGKEDGLHTGVESASWAGECGPGQAVSPAPAISGKWSGWPLRGCRIGEAAKPGPGSGDMAVDSGHARLSSPPERLALLPGARVPSADDHAAGSLAGNVMLPFCPSRCCCNCGR